MSEIKCESYKNESICKWCKNESICKWCNDMKFKQEQINKIPVTEGLTPVRIKIECKSYKRKIKKQDGFWDNYYLTKNNTQY